MGSICDLKEPGGSNIPLIWCLVLIGTLSSNMRWQTRQDKHAVSLRQWNIHFQIERYLFESAVWEKLKRRTNSIVIWGDNCVWQGGESKALGSLRKHKAWLTWFPALTEVYLLIRARRGPLNEQVHAQRCMCVSARVADLCPYFCVPTSRSRFQSRISAMPKYPFSFRAGCLKKMSGFRIKSLSGGI